MSISEKYIQNKWSLTVPDSIGQIEHPVDVTIKDKQIIFDCFYTRIVIPIEISTRAKKKKTSQIQAKYEIKDPFNQKRGSKLEGSAEIKLDKSGTLHIFPLGFQKRVEWTIHSI